MINRVEISNVNTSKLQVLTQEETKELFKKMKSGDKDAIDNHFFESNQDIVSEGGKISEDEVNLELEGHEKKEVTNIGEKEQGSEEIIEEVSENMENIDSAVDKEITENKEKIFIYITGEVNIPGVVILDKGSRIVDAINAAGGTTNNADISKVNLVYVLSDGMKVNIPSSSDLKDNHSFEYITMNSGDESKDDFVENEGNSDFESSNGSQSSASKDSGNVKNYSIVNINTATQTELESLPGIGPSLALKIINYRKQNGKFSSIEEIKNVSGIGDSKFEAMKKYIRV